MSVVKKEHITLKVIESQRVLFSAAFGLGTLGLLILREFGFGSMVSSAYAILIMILYLIICMRKSLLYRPSTLGDNLYYLGFLYTLVSLSYTLFKYSEQVDITFIIQNFGIAMATTLFGLFGRVTLNQERDDPELYEHAVRMSLTDAAASTIGETNKIRADISTLRTSIIQSVNEGVSSAIIKLNDSVADSSSGLDAYLNQLLTEFKNSLVIAATEMSKRFNDRHAEIEQHTKDTWSRIQSELEENSINQSRLAKETNRFLGAMEKLNQSLVGVKPIDESVFDSLSEPARKLEIEIKTLGNVLTNTTIGLVGVRETADGLGAELERISNSFNVDFSKYMNLITSDISSLSSVVNNLSGVVANLGGLLQNQAIEITKLSKLSNDGYSQLIDDIRTSSEEARANVKALQDGLVNVTHAIVDSLKSNEGSKSA